MYISILEKPLLIMDKYVIHSFEHVGVGESFAFQPLLLSNIIIVFLPSNVTSVVRPLVHGLIGFFKV